MQILRYQKHIIDVLEGRNIYYLMPTNLEQERRRFFAAREKDKTYSPVFTYHKILFKQDEIQKQIEQLIRYRGQYEECIQHFGRRAQIFLHLIQHRGKSDFTKFSKCLYGTPDREVLDYAHQLLESTEDRSHEKKYTAAAIQERFEPLVARYGWHIILEPISSKMKVVPRIQQLVIDPESSFSEKDARRLEYHEIKTHIVRQAENKKLPPLIQNCFDYIRTEEGLALHMEEIHDCLSSNQARRYAARVLAVHHALSEPFSEVFERVCNLGFLPETAFRITARAKRGLHDTSTRGGFTKDHIYLTGKLEIEHFLQEGGDIKDLFLGKIGIDDIPYVKKILEG
ncbi:MAG: tyrosine/phenylalanine carboxypeptidase domain-containing protein [Nanoarchaeota archaeon]